MHALVFFDYILVERKPHQRKSRSSPCETSSAIRAFRPSVMMHKSLRTVTFFRRATRGGDPSGSTRSPSHHRDRTNSSSGTSLNSPDELKLRRKMFSSFGAMGVRSSSS
ncbi:hypothetical protein K438DRAFT_44781 [Mycena galopus ATCC 62051]|nr:hypothetical protein K438DRAFT_44781 [Mycena galopus ATCC 62051]